MDSIRHLPGPAAVPHRDGEPVFQAPWEARAFAMAVTLLQDREYVWDDFRDRLIAEIAAAQEAGPDRASGTHYYERWLASFEKLLVEKKILTKDAIEARITQLASSQAKTD